MNSQQFLLLNIAILIVFVLWFLAGRRGQKKTTQLQMKQGNQPARGGVLQKGEQTGSQSRYSHPRFQEFLENDSAARAREGKELNVLFNYNGHTWDAYEVFGVPAGSSLVEVTKAYQRMLQESAPESHEFLETAFKSILGKK